MDSKRRVTAVLLTVVVVGGMGIAGAAQTGANGVTGVQETTTADGESSTVAVLNMSAPSEVQVGTNYTVTADVVNRGETETVRQVTYHIEGNVIESMFVELSPNVTETVTFNVSGANTTGFPSGTFTQGVATNGSEVTANLTLTDSDETASEATETTTTEETTTETTTEETTTTETTTTETTTTETTTTETTTTETTTTETTEAPTEAEADGETADTASLTFENQTSDGSTVTVQSVSVPEGGFVVIHDNGVVEGEVVDSILGTSGYLDAGTSENVTVQLDEPLDQSQQLIAVVYRDSNDNQEFDLVTSNRTADGPYTKVNSNEAVNGIAVIDVNGETTNETAGSAD